MAMLKLARPAFWAALVGAYVLAVLPQPPDIGAASDKLNHMFAFFTLAVLVSAAWPRLAPMRALIWLATFGALIEITQLIPALGRDAEFLDFAADVVAASLGLAVATPLRRWSASLA